MQAEIAGKVTSFRPFFTPFCGATTMVSFRGPVHNSTLFERSKISRSLWHNFSLRVHFSSQIIKILGTTHGQTHKSTWPISIDFGFFSNFSFFATHSPDLSPRSGSRSHWNSTEVPLFRRIRDHSVPEIQNLELFSPTRS